MWPEDGFGLDVIRPVDLIRKWLPRFRAGYMAVEAAPPGSVLHAVGDEGVPFREIAETMGRHLDLKTKSVAPEDAPEHFGFMAHFVALDSPVTATATRKLLGWEPTGVSLIEDLEHDHYYRSV